MADLACKTLWWAVLVAALLCVPWGSVIMGLMKLSLLLTGLLVLALLVRVIFSLFE